MSWGSDRQYRKTHLPFTCHYHALHVLISLKLPSVACYVVVTTFRGGFESLPLRHSLIEWDLAQLLHRALGFDPLIWSTIRFQRVASLAETTANFGPSASAKPQGGYLKAARLYQATNFLYESLLMSSGER